jgi:lysophospholipid acyltransferase (LPLAT)-like uncharacterized protein
VIPVRTRLAHAVLAGLARTWRIEVVGAEHLSAARDRGTFLYALWHRTLLPLLWWHRAQQVTLLVSRHADGALVADAAGALGYRVVRGSSSRGGAAAFRAVLRALRTGGAVAVTPDGPRGPGGVVKPGVVVAARRSGAPILPVSAAADRAWRARSWDGLAVPQPFARVRVAYGPPWHPPPDDAAACRELAARLDGLARTAASPGAPQ